MARAAVVLAFLLAKLPPRRIRVILRTAPFWPCGRCPESDEDDAVRGPGSGLRNQGSQVSGTG